MRTLSHPKKLHQTSTTYINDQNFLNSNHIIYTQGEPTMNLKERYIRSQRHLDLHLLQHRLHLQQIFFFSNRSFSNDLADFPLAETGEEEISAISFICFSGFLLFFGFFVGAVLRWTPSCVKSNHTKMNNRSGSKDMTWRNKIIWLELLTFFI